MRQGLPFVELSDGVYEVFDVVDNSFDESRHGPRIARSRTRGRVVVMWVHTAIWLLLHCQQTMVKYSRGNAGSGSSTSAGEYSSADPVNCADYKRLERIIDAATSACARCVTVGLARSERRRRTSSKLRCRQLSFVLASCANSASQEWRTCERFIC